MSETRDQRTEQNGQGAEPPPPESVGEEADRHFEKLQRGRKLNLLGEPLSIRSIKAVGLFVGVFTAVLLVTWLVIGDIGMVLGAILGSIAAVWIVKAYSDRLGRGDEGPDSPPATGSERA
jgi:hypothetical protein